MALLLLPQKAVQVVASTHQAPPPEGLKVFLTLRLVLLLAAAMEVSAGLAEHLLVNKTTAEGAVVLAVLMALAALAAMVFFMTDQVRLEMGLMA